MLLSKNLKKTESVIKRRYNEWLYKIKNLRNTNMEVGLCHLYMGNIFDASMRFKLILTVKPDDTEALYNLGRCYLKKNKFAKALEIFESTLDKHQLAKYQYEKMTGSLSLEKIPSAILQERAQHVAIYKIFNNHSEKHLNKIIIDAIYKYCDTEKKLQIIDLCCCNGDTAMAIKKRGIDCDIIGIDIAHTAVEHCSNLSLHNNPTIKVYSQVVLKTDSQILAPAVQPCNVLICLEYMSFYRNLNQMLKNLRQSLLDKAIAIISLFNEETQDIEIDELNDHFCFSRQFVVLTAQQNGLTVCAQHHSKNSLFINNNSTIYVLQRI